MSITFSLWQKVFKTDIKYNLFTEIKQVMQKKWKSDIKD